MTRHHLVGSRRIAIVLLAALGLFVSFAYARPVGKDEAAAAVGGWLKHPGHGLKARIGDTVKDVEVYKDGAGEALYYVVNLKPSGFVIVPADDSAEPVICFSVEGKYVASDKNPLGALVMRDIPARLAFARAKPAADNPRARLMVAQAAAKGAQQKWDRFRSGAAAPLSAPPANVSDLCVAPLIQSQWDQAGVPSGYCYNYYTPKHEYCGCVATAMAQLMRFHQYPIAGVATATFSITVDGQLQTAALRGGDGAGGPYDWADMVLAPASAATELQRQAIGALCYDAGVAAHMEYTSGSSGAYATDAAAALRNVFHFGNLVCGGAGVDVGVGLNGMINPNLDAGYPVLLSVRADTGSGHEIIADGYGYDSGTLYHHLNMGWSGAWDAWYNLPQFATGYNWQSVPFCIYNVYSAGSGEIVSGRVTSGLGAPLSGVTVTATRAGGGTYSAVTNDRGVYFFAKVPPASSYALNAVKTGFAFAPLNVSTGTSRDYVETSGNVWGADFVASGNPQLWTLTVTSAPAQGAAILGTHSGTTNYTLTGVADGTFVSVTASGTMVSGGVAYKFVQWTAPSGWTVVGATVSGTMQADATLEADYAPQAAWTLVIQSPTGSGSTSPATGTTTYAVGTGASVQANAATGWTFDHWGGDAVAAGHEADNPLSIASGTAGQTRHVAAFFAVLAPQWTLAIQAPSGSGTTTPATGNYACGVGSDASVQANAATGWKFDHWAGDGVAAGHESDNPLSVASGAAGGTRHVTAAFAQQQWTLVVQDPTGGGTTAPPPGSFPCAVGTGIMVQANPASGWFFDHWAGDGVAAGHETDNPLTVDSGTDGQTKYLTAVFVQHSAKWTLNVASTPFRGLAIIGTYPGKTNYSAPNVADGTVVNVSVPQFDPSGYVFLDWKVTPSGGVPVVQSQRSVTFVMTGDTTVVAEYRAVSYSIVNVQSTPIAGIWISSGTGHAGRTNYSKQGLACGTVMNLSAPALDPAGYAFARWRVNGATQAQGQKTVNFTVTGATTAVAEYRSGGYIVAIQSAPVTGAMIASATGHAGATNYSKNAPDGTTVSLAAPMTVASNGVTYSFVGWTAPAGWTISGAAISGAVHADATLEADYTATTVWTLNVSSTPIRGVAISGTCPGTTNYTVAGVADGKTVSLSVPASDPPSYAFADWKVTVGAAAPVTTTQRTTTFNVSGNTAAVAEYTSVGPVLTVQSAPVVGLAITSTTGHAGTTNYSLNVPAGTSVNLNATSADPAGYTFAQWRLNGTAQAAGLKAATFTVTGATTVCAEYRPVSCVLNVQSTPVKGLQISSGTGYGGATNYSRQGIAYGTSVALAAPTGDPAGYVFAQWRLNGAAQAAGQRTISFSVNSATMTAVAEYALVSYVLSVQSTPLSGIMVASSTANGGTTDYSQNVPTGASVYLRVPTVDPPGFTFTRWRFNGTAQAPGQKILIFILTGPVTAIAEYGAIGG